jgi:hypothetical protein
MQSQIFGVKSNAARAAKRYGVARDQLIAVSGGWCFEIPSETAPQFNTEPATGAIDSAHVETHRPTAQRLLASPLRRTTRRLNGVATTTSL